MIRGAAGPVPPACVLALFQLCKNRREGGGSGGGLNGLFSCVSLGHSGKHWVPLCGYFLAMSIASSPLKLLLGQILCSPNKCFLFVFKGPPEDKNKQHDPWVTSPSYGVKNWSSCVVMGEWWDNGPLGINGCLKAMSHTVHPIFSCLCSLQDHLQ